MRIVKGISLLVGMLLGLGTWDTPYAEPIPAEHTTIAIATTSTAVSVGWKQPQRTFLELQNDSDTAIYCDLTGGVAVVGKGERLSASGGTLLLDMKVPQGAIACIQGASGTKNLILTQSPPLASWVQ